MRWRQKRLAGAMLLSTLMMWPKDSRLNASGGVHFGSLQGRRMPDLPPHSYTYNLMQVTQVRDSASRLSRGLTTHFPRSKWSEGHGQTLLPRLSVTLPYQDASMVSIANPIVPCTLYFPPYQRDKIELSGSTPNHKKIYLCCDSDLYSWDVRSWAFPL